MPQPVLDYRIGGLNMKLPLSKRASYCLALLFSYWMLSIPCLGVADCTVEDASLAFSEKNIAVGMQGQERFTVDGDLPTAIESTDMTLGSQGTLEFRLGMLGVTPLSLTGELTVLDGGSIVIDGTAYEGLDGYFPLVKVRSLVGTIDSNNVTFMGLNAREPALVVQGDGVWLRLTTPSAFSTHLCSLVPESTVATDYSNTQFSATRSLDPSGSPWSLTLHEAHVMDTRLSQNICGDEAAATNRSWELRVGRGGHIYSLRTPALGETVPPQWRSTGDTSPWNDEVWQGVAVDTSLNSGESKYFIHQSGTYMKDAALEEPFYSPQVAAELDWAHRSFTTINWGQHAHVGNYTNDNPNDDWQSHLLYYTRFRDLGQGLIEVSLGFYNYGPDHLNYFNMPWGGVRRTSTEYVFLSQPGGFGWSDAIEGSFGSGASANYATTGGSIAFSSSPTGDTTALGLVFGFDADTLLPLQTSPSVLRYGYAGGTFRMHETNWRNYYVISAIRRYALGQGRGVWARYYFVLGDDINGLSIRIAERSLVAHARLIPFDYTEATTPLVGYRCSGSGLDFRVTEDRRSPHFFLYAHPVTGSFPIYEIIENDKRRYLTWNPYATGVIKTYDGTIAGIRLLGFAPRTSDVSSRGMSSVYASLADTMLGFATNYIAAGEDLSVRIPLQ